MMNYFEFLNLLLNNLLKIEIQINKFLNKYFKLHFYNLKIFRNK